MNYEVIYEIGKFQIPGEFIFLVTFFVLITLKLMSMIYDIVKGDRSWINIFFVIILIFFSPFIGLLSVSSFLSGGGENVVSSKLYYSGQYSVVEGQVYNFNEIALNSQDYYVDGVYFSVMLHDDTFGDIKKNGDQVRISYIPGEDGEEELNYIVKLEIAK
jgi:hypothetical protein